MIFPSGLQMASHPNMLSMVVSWVAKLEPLKAQSYSTCLGARPFDAQTKDSKTKCLIRSPNPNRLVVPVVPEVPRYCAGAFGLDALDT